MDRRTHYLDTALQLFLEHGFNGVSMDQLVAAAGGSKATLYRYFDSKDRLFEAIIDDLSHRAPASEADGDLGALDLEEGLRTLGRAIATVALSDRVIVLLRLAIGEFARFPNLAITLYDHGPAVSYERLRLFIAAQQGAGEIEVPAPQIAAEQFLGGIIGHQQLRMALGVGTPTSEEIEERIDAAVTSFVATYRRVVAVK